MHIAFAIVKYFPHGGSQRDCLALAKMLVKRGHVVTILTTDWVGEKPDCLTVVEMPLSARTNHGLNDGFSAALADRARLGTFDGIVGFNKLGGLDIYFVADICLAPSVTGVKRFFPRYRSLLDLEDKVFGLSSDTYHLFLTQIQSDQYAASYPNSAHGSVVLAPLLDPSRVVPNDSIQARQRIRAEIGVSGNTLLIVNVAAQYEIKGVDRVVDMLSQIEDVVFLSVGLKSTEKLFAAARRSIISDRVIALGHREDIPDILCASDLMVHPARKENTGAVILESLVCGTPVICSAACGNAEFVKSSGCGFVIPEPFDEITFTQAVSRALEPECLRKISEMTRNFGSDTSSFCGREQAVDVIISELERRQRQT